MSTLKVRAHWTSVTNSIPASLSGYGTPPNMNTTPTWPPTPTGPVGSNGIYHVWCPLVAQGDLDAAQWGANTVAPPPSWPTASGAATGTFDQGYSKAATDFKVTGLRLWQDGKPGTDFTYKITAPNGSVVGTVTPAAPGWTPINLPAPINSGKGLWKIDIDRAAGSSVGAPGLQIGAAPAAGVNEPYVSPYGNRFEGILGLEFTGDEVGTNCYDIHVTHSGTIPCIRSGQTVNVTFNASFTPATPPFAGTVYWQVRDGLGNLLPTPTSTGATMTYTFNQKGQYEVTATIFQPGCANQAPSDTDTINIVDCTCPSIIGSPNGIQVSSTNMCTFSFSVLISNPSGGTTIFTWDFGDGTGPHVLSSSVTWTYPALTSGTKTVTVTLTSSDPACSDRATTQVQVKCGATTPTPTTTTPTPTTTTPTTMTPTPTGTGTGSPTPTPTPTPTTTSGGGGFGLCGFGVLVALILFGIAAVGLAVGGCLGPAGTSLMAGAVPVAATGFIVLALWMLFCRDCKLMRFLQKFFGAMALVMAGISVVLMLIGMVTCAFGAAAVALLFGAIVAALSIGIAALGCP